MGITPEIVDCLQGRGDIVPKKKVKNQHAENMEIFIKIVLQEQKIKKACENLHRLFRC